MAIFSFTIESISLQQVLQVYDFRVTVDEKSFEWSIKRYIPTNRPGAPIISELIWLTPGHPKYTKEEQDAFILNIYNTYDDII